MERARALDDTLPEIYVLSATLKEDRDWDFKGSENDYRRAIELDPNFATAYHALSRTLGGALGRYDEAIAMINKAHELDPFSRSIAFNIGGRFADARRFDEAIAQYKRVLEMEPDHPLTHLVLGRAYDAKRMYPEAIDSYRTAEVLLEKLSQADADEKAAALIASLKIGEKGYWKKRLEYARADLKSGVGSNVNIAGCLAILGEMDEALRHLEIAFAGREHELIWIRSDHSFDVLSKDPRFDDLLRRVGVKS
jgi:tetratricopeptide (TPR) repeat protein